ncbi:MAG: PD40 domain-containing protein, partial [Deltaproteobacteria bacterium]|nr:PD40 domain-containing protein [Deltaproteobacteria bacterium]
MACGGGEPTGTLLWVAERGGRPDVWASAPDGSDARRLTDLPGASFPAGVDPLGTHALVVTAEDDARGHREGMWLVPLDGGPAAPFGPRSERIRNPVFTPDGATVLFEADLESYRDLYAVPRAGGKIRRLTDAPHGSFEPAIGAQLAFGTSRDGNAEIYVATPDGTGPVRLTADPADDVHPGWRPDGARLAWIRAGRVWT